MFTGREAPKYIFLKGQRDEDAGLPFIFLLNMDCDVH